MAFSKKNLNEDKTINISNKIFDVTVCYELMNDSSQDTPILQ
jgi:hypothetical protein